MCVWVRWLVCLRVYVCCCSSWWYFCTTEHSPNPPDSSENFIFILYHSVSFFIYLWFHPFNALLSCLHFTTHPIDFIPKFFGVVHEFASISHPPFLLHLSLLSYFTSTSTHFFSVHQSCGIKLLSTEPHSVQFSIQSTHKVNPFIELKCNEFFFLSNLLTKLFFHHHRCRRRLSHTFAQNDYETLISLSHKAITRTHQIMPLRFDITSKNVTTKT